MSEQTEGWEFAAATGLPSEAIRSAVGYRSSTPTPAVHRGLPSPSLTLVLSLGEPVVAGHSPEHALGPQAYRNDVVLGGLHTTPAYIAQPRVQVGVQLAVRPLASRALFGVPAAELRTLTEGADLLGAAVPRLRDQLAETVSWSDRFALLESYLRGQLRKSERTHEPRPEVVEAWKWLARHRGTGTMTGLARHVLLSQRQLGTLFQAEFGLSPKSASRLMRFEHARQRLARMGASGGEPPLASVAQQCGYYDHSHLVRDFQQYAGTSPTNWFAEERGNIQAGAARDG